jgi:hypothetical protein
MRAESIMLWRGREARLAAYRGKMHGRKSGPANGMARGEFGELTRGELTRFDCTLNFCNTQRCASA